VIDTDDFQRFAHINLVLMNADFPRKKKNQVTAEDQKKNSELAEKYNKEGVFPKLLLLDENGKVLAHWEGLEKLEPDFLEHEILPYFANR
jgi:thioredoxin-related protein